VEEKIKDRLLRVAGVANVEVGGGRERKILIEADQGRLVAYRLSIHRIVSLLGRRNVAVQVGFVEGEKRTASIQLVGSFKTVEEMKKMMVARDPGGGVVLLENVAKVTDSYLEPESLSRLNGQSAVSLYVQKESAANTLQVVRDVVKALDQAWQEISPGVRFPLQRMEVSNQAAGIRQAVGSVRASLVTGVLLIVLVLTMFHAARPNTRKIAAWVLGTLLLFLCATALFKVSQTAAEVPMILLLVGFILLAVFHPDLRPALIVGGSIPLSALFCFLLFKACGISLNVMSLFGLALGIGMLVDNAIVVFENITGSTSPPSEGGILAEEGEPRLKTSPVSPPFKGGILAEEGEPRLKTSPVSPPFKGGILAEEGEPRPKTSPVSPPFKGGEKGAWSLSNVLKATEETVIPLIGATVTNAVVFVPFLFLSKDIQRLYTDVAAAVGASLFASLGVSLTVVPLLASRLTLGASQPKTRLSPGLIKVVQPLFLTRFFNVFHQILIPIVFTFSKILQGKLRNCCTIALRKIQIFGKGDEETLKFFLGLALFLFAGLWAVGQKGGSKAVFCLVTTGLITGAFLLFRTYARHWPALLQRRLSILAVSGGLTLAAVGVLVWATDRDFQASGELDEFVVFVELSSGAKLSVSNEVIKELEEKIRSHPQVAPCVKTLVSRVEGWSSKVYVTLKPRAERRLTTQKVVSLLREALQDAGRDKDNNAFVHFSSPQTGQEIAVQVMGPDYAVLERLAQEICSGLEKVKGLEDVKMRFRPGRPEVQAVIDPDKAGQYGLTAEEVAETTHGLMRGLRATTFRTQGTQVETIVRLRLEDRHNLSALADLPLLTRSGQSLRLRNVARLEMGKMPNEIHRENKQRLIQITANRSGVSLGRAAEDIQKVLDRVRFPLEYYAALEGDVEEMARSFRQLTWGILVMVLLVYLVLVLLFESLLQPLIIMTTVPLCLVGAAWGLSLLRIPITTGVLVGLMMLGGIVVNNAIMLLDRFNANPDPELSQRLLESVQARMRPIFLTAGSAVLGFLPMMLDTSESGALWRPLSVTMVFGLLTSTVMTLYVVPCVSYVLLQDIPLLFRGRLGNRLFFNKEKI
jgi:multidrug efflux pump subunit AcrB